MAQEKVKQSTGLIKQPFMAFAETAEDLNNTERCSVQGHVVGVSLKNLVR